MKKVFTLLVAFGLLTAANAQQRSGDRRDDDNRYENRDDEDFNNRRYNDNKDYRYNDNRFSSDRNLRMQAARINQRYDHEIEHVRYDHHMRSFEKGRTIRFLEQQRQQELRMLYEQSRNKNKRNKHSNGHY